MNAKYLWLGLIFFTLSAWANDIEKSHDLWQAVEQTTQQREAAVLAPDNKSEKVADIAIKGTNDAHTLALKVMEAINRGDRAALESVLAVYEEINGQDEALVLFAHASLARMGSDTATAEAAYQALLARYPDFVRGRLDLARLWFDDWENQAAQQAFAAIDTTHLPAVVTQNITGYLNALELRQTAHGAFSFGAVYSDNLNQSSRQSDCLLYNSDSTCFYRRSSPDAVGAVGLGYDAAAGKRFAIKGHHGLALRAALYGNAYRQHKEYNETNIALAAGYSFRNRRNDFSLSPLFEYDIYANRAFYRAPGVRLLWSRTWSDHLNSNIQIDYKRLSYLAQNYRHNDGGQTAVYTTFSYTPANRTVYYGGIDFLHQQARAPSSIYRQIGIRLGLYRQFEAGLTLNANAAVRRRQYNAYDAVLQAQRHDTEQVYGVSLSAPRLVIGGFTPVLTVRHNRVKSNVGWLYSYHKNEVGLKLEKYF